MEILPQRIQDALKDRPDALNVETLKTILKKRMDKFKEPFPERFFHLPDQEIVPIGNDAQTEILKEIARLTTRRLHRYKNVYKQ